MIILAKSHPISFSLPLYFTSILQVSLLPHKLTAPENATTSSSDNSWFDSNKKWGSGFDISKMTKDEIAKKFDKHAPNWYYVYFFKLHYLTFNSFRQVFVEKSKYEPVFDWIKESTAKLENKSGTVLGMFFQSSLTIHASRHSLTIHQIWGVGLD
jgi:hypothetical protein